ncbi:MAG: Cathepsin L [Fimbriimonas ginsengisoli]|uniref:Cathepsin L n=1 Tax=Fimbriimonas ginsengisoli TaxID=1005039 RepID=A0A931LUC1_FIMGI|nr:Cathepsin L [Fimbriimonas ginsengisoli]
MLECWKEGSILKYRVHTLFVALSLVAVATLGSAQVPPLPKPPPNEIIFNYQDREAKAPAAIKSRLAALRSEILAKHFTFKVGYTGPADRPLELIAGMTKVPKNFRELALVHSPKAVELLRHDAIAMKAYMNKNRSYRPFLLPNSHSAAVDLRQMGRVSPVKDQGYCGSCWDFAACSSYESSDLIRNNRLVDDSEQQILGCSGGGTCAGGWYMPVFNWMMAHGVTSEAKVPYLAVDGSAAQHTMWAGEPDYYFAAAWGFVIPDGGIPSVQQIKDAMMQHGAISVAVWADSAFQHYTSGIYNEHVTNMGINHAVTLVGWDDSKHAWLMKNSWGHNWGDTCGFGTERGYMWIDYNCNLVGYHAAWVDAKSVHWVIPHGIYQSLFKDLMIKPHPEG